MPWGLGEVILLSWTRANRCFACLHFYWGENKKENGIDNIRGHSSNGCFIPQEGFRACVPSFHFQACPRVNESEDNSINNKDSLPCCVDAAEAAECDVSVRSSTQISFCSIHILCHPLLPVFAYNKRILCACSLSHSLLRYISVAVTAPHTGLAYVLQCFDWFCVDARIGEDCMGNLFKTIPDPSHDSLLAVDISL